MKKKITLIIIAVLLVLSLVVGLSYAYWRITYTATKVNKIVSSCFSMELTNEKNNIVLDDAYPISDEKGKSLTPYSFTITNTCDLFASYTINLEMLEGTTLNSKYIKMMINSEAITNLNTLETTDTSIDGATESRILFRGSLGSGDSTDYTLRIWMDSDTPFNEDSMNKLFQAKITVTAEVSTYSPVENGFTNLADALLVNEYQTTSLDVAKNKINNKQSVDFSKTAPLIEWQEKHNSNIISKVFTKADPALIGSYGITEQTTKILLSKTYTFNSSTGYYTLTDKTYYNPEDVDFSAEDYYVCNTSIGSTADNKVNATNGLTCSVMSKIISYDSVSDGTLTLYEGDVITSKKHSFSVVEYGVMELESDKSDKGLYASVDDDGTTYYYRGNVSNNYIKFADFYWKVIRINGDGSIRLIYAGADANSSGANQSIKNSRINSVRDNATYVGYMYSNVLNISYENTIRNDNDSSIKVVVDTWYTKNILNKGYSSYLADSGFCNDRSLSPESESDGNSSSENVSYGGRYRVYDNSIPSFRCPNASNDLFTLAGNTEGNQALTYPIGLITADEASYAGLVSLTLNSMNYLISGETFWTMTPNYYAPSVISARVLLVSSVGVINYGNANNSYGVRPVINLKADTEITGGIGTKNDPFIVK